MDIPSSTSHRLQAQTEATAPAPRRVRQDGSSGQRPAALPRERSHVVSDDAMSALFREATELTLSKRIPQSVRHRMAGGAESQGEARLQAGNRALTQAIHQHGPQARFAAAAMDAMPERVLQGLSEELAADGADPGEIAELSGRERRFAERRTQNSPEGRAQLKQFIDGILADRLGPQRGSALAQQYRVLSCSTNHDTDLRPAGSAVPVRTVAVQGGMQAVNQPVHEDGSPGTCFGQVSRFLSEVHEKWEDGASMEDAVRAGSNDRDNIVQGALRQKVYLNQRHGLQAQAQPIIAAFQSDIAQIQEDQAAGRISETDAETLKMQRTEQYLADLRPLGESLFERYDQKVVENFVADPDDPGAPVDDALDAGGLTMIVGNAHAVGLVQQEGDFFVFDPTFGAYETSSRDAARELVMAALETGEDSPIAGMNFGSLPDRA